MYWVDTEAGTLHRLVGETVENLLPNVQNATSLTLDTIHGKIYWTEKISERSGKIHTANLDGSNAQLLKDLKSVPLDIALDAINATLYLANDRGKIQRLNLNTSNFLPNPITGLESPQHLTLDVARGKLYWTEQAGTENGKIQRADLDGSNVALVKHLSYVPHGIAIDTKRGKLYLTSAVEKIQRMNLDGSGFNRNFIKGLESLGEISVDVIGSKLYWVQGNHLRRANLKGDNIQEVVIRLGAPANLTLGIAQVQDTLAAAPVQTAGPDQTLTLYQLPESV